jgi:hypothetical protein
MNSVGKRQASENQYRSRLAFIPESMNPTLREYYWSREGIALVSLLLTIEVRAHG